MAPFWTTLATFWTSLAPFRRSLAPQKHQKTALLMPKTPIYPKTPLVKTLLLKKGEGVTVRHPCQGAVCPKEPGGVTPDSSRQLKIPSVNSVKKTKRIQFQSEFIDSLPYTARLSASNNRNKSVSNMEQQKIYVSDLDGTLLGTGGVLSAFSRRHLTDLLRAGLHFTVASARAWAEIVPVVGDLPLTLPVIAINGAFITEYATGKHLVINNLPRDLAETVYRHILNEGLLPFIVTHNGTEDCLYWQELTNEEMQWYHDTLHVHKDRRIRRIEDLKHAFAEQVIAFAVMGPRPQVTALSEVLADTFPGLLENFLFENPASPGHWWLTIHDQRACKSKAIRTLVEMTGHRLENLTVFGDHINDIKMLQLAGTGVAMANAEEELKAHADIVIGPNTDDAVVKYIEGYQ